jgi:hypothetical protein
MVQRRARLRETSGACKAWRKVPRQGEIQNEVQNPREIPHKISKGARSEALIHFLWHAEKDAHLVGLETPKVKPVVRNGLGAGGVQLERGEIGHVVQFEPRILQCDFPSTLLPLHVESFGQT